MRIIVMFDMPMENKSEKQEYAKFRKFLLKDGYIMLQYSIYSRFCRNNSNLGKHLTRLRNNTPKYGNVRILQITEKQYIDMEIIIGKKSIKENAITRNALTII